MFSIVMREEVPTSKEKGEEVSCQLDLTTRYEEVNVCSSRENMRVR